MTKLNISLYYFRLKKICNHAYLFENIEESDSISFHTHCINIKTSPIQYFIHKLLFILYKKTTSSCNFLKTSEIFWIFSKLNLTIENGLALLYGNDIQKLVILFHSLTNLPKSQPFELFSIKNKFTDQILPKPLKTSLKFFMPKVEAGQFIIKTSSVQLSEKFYELLLRPLTSCASNCFNSNESYSPIMQKIQKVTLKSIPDANKSQSFLIENSRKLKNLHNLLKFNKTGKTVVLCQMTKMLDILEDYFISQHLLYTRIDGCTLLETRQIQINKYKSDPKIQFFLCTSRACLNLDLTNSNTLILFETDNKAEPKIFDCLLSNSKTKPIFIHRLFSSSTIEQEIIKIDN